MLPFESANAILLVDSHQPGALMKKWRGDWNCRNIHVSEMYGKSGTDEVSAHTKEQAKKEIQLRASRQLIGTTMKWQSINVHRIVEV